MISAGTVVLSDRDRAGAVAVGVSGIEAGAGASSIEIGLAAFRQDEQGRLHAQALDGGPHTAAAFIRYGPRRFVAVPGQAQMVRLAARPPADLPPGEYRMHLRMLNTGELGSEPQDESQEPGGDISVRIPIRVARAVRVLYRHHIEPQPGRLQDVTVEREGEHWRLGFSVVREGAASLIASYQAVARDAAGNELRHWEAKGLSIYPEIARRILHIELPAAELPEGATLCVRLRHTDQGVREQSVSEACAE